MWKVDQIGDAGGRGFEPRLAESESAVLPLDDPPRKVEVQGVLLQSEVYHAAKRQARGSLPFKRLSQRRPRLQYNEPSREQATAFLSRRFIVGFIQPRFPWF